MSNFPVFYEHNRDTPTQKKWNEGSASQFLPQQQKRNAEYYNRSPTNPDVNYNPPRTSLTPLFTFDVKSLFTSIPLQLTLQCTETAIGQSTDPLPLPTEEIMDLLNLSLASTYFSTAINTTNGTAMGSPVSVVVAESGKCPFDLPTNGTALVTLRWRYIHRRTTRQSRRKGKLPFLDCLLRRDDNSLRTTVYRKPTHTDRLLDESFCNPTSHKATTIRTLTRRAWLVCNTTDSLFDENKYLDCVFPKNNYNEDFIRRNTHRLTTTTEANDNATPTTTATIPYIKGISEKISRILQPFNIPVAYTTHYHTSSVTD